MRGVKTSSPFALGMKNNEVQSAFSLDKSKFPFFSLNFLIKNLKFPPNVIVKNINFFYALRLYM